MFFPTFQPQWPLVPLYKVCIFFHLFGFDLEGKNMTRLCLSLQCLTAHMPTQGTLTCHSPPTSTPLPWSCTPWHSYLAQDQCFLQSALFCLHSPCVLNTELYFLLTQTHYFKLCSNHPVHVHLTPKQDPKQKSWRLFFKFSTFLA